MHNAYDIKTTQNFNSWNIMKLHHNCNSKQFFSLQKILRIRRSGSSVVQKHTLLFVTGSAM